MSTVAAEQNAGLPDAQRPARRGPVEDRRGALAGALPAHLRGHGCVPIIDASAAVHPTAVSDRRRPYRTGLLDRTEREHPRRPGPDHDRRAHQHPGQLRAPHGPRRIALDRRGRTDRPRRDAARVHDRPQCLDRMGAIVMDNAFIENDVIVAAATWCPARRACPPECCLSALPAKVARPLTQGRSCEQARVHGALCGTRARRHRDELGAGADRRQQPGPRPLTVPGHAATRFALAPPAPCCSHGYLDAKLNGIEATRSILQRAPHAGIVMLSMHSTCRRW